VKLALDPYMFRTTALLDLPGLVADLGYRYIELSPREDFTPFFLHPRANRDVVTRFKRALAAAGVEIATHLPLVPMVRTGRGRAAGGGAVLEAGHSADRGSRLPGDEFGVQRPA
jgi:sugar phosphate isomerase/epimerase